MKILALAMVLLGLWPPPTATAATRKEDAVAAYRKLSPQDVESHPIGSLPKGVSVERIDVSPKFRSASFGHATTLLVPEHGDVFYVEYGRSTNAPIRLFGPFPLL